MKNNWRNNAVLKRYAEASRPQQEVFVARLSQVMVVGTVISILSLFCMNLNPFVGAIFLPVALVAAWFVATKMVAPRMVQALDNYLDSRAQ